jgi:hypothetical protein
MEKSGRAIDAVSFTGWPDARVIPLFLKEKHRTATQEHPAKATRACEMAGLYAAYPLFAKGFLPGNPPKRRSQPGKIG